MEGAVFHATTIINVVDTDSDTLCATCFGDEHIFDSANLKHTHLVRGDSGCLGVVVNNSLAREGRRKVDRVSREERLLRDYEVRLVFFHKGSIRQKRGDVKG